MSLRRRFVHISLSVLFTLSVILFVQNGSRNSEGQLDFSGMKTLPILLEGRVVPFDTYARKFSYTVAGSQRPFKTNSIEFVMNYVKNQNPLTENIIKIDNHALKESLGIDKSKRYTSFKHTTDQKVLTELQNVYQHKTDQKMPLTPLDEAFGRLSEQLNMISELVQGTSLQFYPATRNKYTNWTPAVELEQVTDAEAQQAHVAFQKLLHANYHNKQKELDEAVAELKGIAFERHPLGEIYKKNFENELIYNTSKPFRVAWIVYLLALIAAVIGRINHIPTLRGLGLWLMVSGFIVHSYGLILRTIILDRPPVSNMYESVVFVGWAVIIFSFTLLFQQKYKRKDSHVLLTSTLLAATLTMVMADLLPMSSELGMLEAVLRSTYWLTIHVLVIVASYGAFALACALGHIYLVNILIGTSIKEALMRDIADSIYQSIKIGVILIGAGTILGGVWANESWGRFWGWDPKETWALISFLGYMALLHGRKAGWFRDFGLAVGSLLGFLLILMTWYGVNFVLGTGLHSYGFGSGGQNYALGFTLFELIFLIFVFLRLKNDSSPPSPDTLAS